MDMDEYCLHYDAFHREFVPLAGPPEKAFKLAQECQEYIEAYKQPLEKINHIDEAVDVMNTAIAYLRSECILDPLWHGVMKLEKTAHKYRGRLNEQSA